VLDAATRRLLTADEAKLIEQTSVAALDKKTLDEVGAIYDRVRKGRDKYRGLHRRQASNQVRRDHARGTGANKNLGSSSKYEIFEEALGRVSEREADLAKQSAGELKKARLIAAAAAAEAAKSAAPVPPRAKKAAAKKTPAKKAPAKKAAAPAAKKNAAPAAKKAAAPAKKAVQAAPARATKGPAPKSKSATSKVRSSVSRSNQARTQARRDGR
jgi:hypothetical protein